MSKLFTAKKRFLITTRKVINVSKIVLTEKIPMNLTLLAVIIILSVASFEFFTPSETPTGNVVLDCPTCKCDTVDLKEEQDCSLCPIKTKIEEIVKYQCPHGQTVDSLEQCVDFFPTTKNKPFGTVEEVTLAIDNIETEKDGDIGGFVTRIDYTIINKGKEPLVPQIQVKVYDEWDLKVKKSEANKIINPEIVVNPGDYVKRKDDVRIFFEGSEATVRLLLVNSLPVIDKEVVAVTKDISVS